MVSKGFYLSQPMKSEGLTMIPPSWHTDSPAISFKSIPLTEPYQCPLNQSSITTTRGLTITPQLPAFTKHNNNPPKGLTKPPTKLTN